MRFILNDNGFTSFLISTGNLFQKLTVWSILKVINLKTKQKQNKYFPVHNERNILCTYLYDIRVKLNDYGIWHFHVLNTDKVIMYNVYRCPKETF